jgi:predicted DNA-binding transcriptional regulator YafY
VKSSKNKSFRVLKLYEDLRKGEIVRKDILSKKFKVSAKTIQRDIDELRNYFADSHNYENYTIEYDKSKEGYYLAEDDNIQLRNDEVLAISKILLESRAFCESELHQIINKLLSKGSSRNKEQLKSIIQNELFHYVPLQHGKKLLSILWDLTDYILKSEIISIIYKRMDGKETKHSVKPLSIMFSEYYFYLIAYMDESNDSYPIIFRVDRIEDIKATGEKFKVPYKDRFEEGEFRKRVQFMYSGELKKVKFEFSGPSLEAILDKLPTAKIIEEKSDSFMITAESYGDGLNMWLKTQGKYVKFIEKI